MGGTSTTTMVTYMGCGGTDGIAFAGNFVNGLGTIGLIMGGGTSSVPLTTATAGASFFKFYTQSTDTGDDNRLGYFYYNASGVGGGFECIRGKAIGTVAGINALRGGSFAAGVDTTATSQTPGMCAGVQATYEAGAATRVLTGTLASLVCTSFVGSGNTLPQESNSFIRCVDEGSVHMNNLLNLNSVGTGAKSDTALLSTGIGTSSGMAVNTAIRMKANGTTYWVLASTTAPSGTS